MKNKYTIIFILLFIIISQTNVFAIDYSNRYTEYYGINGVATARSPFHLNNTDTGMMISLFRLTELMDPIINLDI